MLTHYLYRHIRLDKNEPFYIGIGKKLLDFNTHLIEYKRAYEKTNRNKFWKNIVAKTDYEVEILLESDDYEFIKQKEIEFIALYKRIDCCKGTLVNMTDGGDGSIGRKWTEEFRENFIKKNSGENHFNFGKKLSKETCDKKSESMKNSDKSLKGKKLPEWWCERISNSVKGENNPMFGKSGDLHHNSKKVINIETKEVFNSIKEASESYKCSFQYISENINRENNYTPFVFYTIYLDKGLDFCKNICKKEKKNKKQGIKKVRNIITGETFESMKKAADSIDMDENVFRYRIRVNKINFEIV